MAGVSVPHTTPPAAGPADPGGGSTPGETTPTAPTGSGMPHTGPAHPGTAAVVAALVRTARPKQWTKNVLVFAAPAAAGVLTHGHILGLAVAAFALFACVSSATYFFNDAIDVEADRAHPLKRDRPMAAGVLPVRIGLVIAAALATAGLAASAAVTLRLTLVLGIYAAVQVAYTVRLKHQPVYDLACVAVGFLLRAIAGGVAVGVPVSALFLMVATFGSLLMVTGKRVAEQQDLGADAGAHRPTLGHYSPAFLRIVLAVAAGGAMLTYSQWALGLRTAHDHHADPVWFQLSIVPVVLALLRYTFLVEGGRGAKPEDLALSDPSLVVLGGVWAGLFSLGVYVH
jgi:decaprenyl-phosphate phosphoribosyltransferase